MSLPELSKNSGKWVSFILFLAALYNLGWGAWAVFDPKSMLRLVQIDGQKTDLLFWQCIGMLVGLYGVMYAFAASDPIRHWPIVLIGLLGKIAGPIGSFFALRNNTLPASFLYINVTNDFIWIIPFIGILCFIRTKISHKPADTKSGSTLYAQAIGESFEHLAPEIKKFHSATSPIEVHGTFCVRRGKNKLGSFLTTQTGFPKAAENLPVRLRVEPTPHKELWHRSFGDRTVDSEQFIRAGTLVEKFGPLVMFLEPRVVDGALVVTDIRSTFLGVPLPPFVTPRVQAHGVDCKDGIKVHIRISCSPLGLLVDYTGMIKIS